MNAFERSITVPADTASLPAVQAFLDKALEEAEFSGHKTMHVSLAAEEAFVNICHYAGVETADVAVRSDSDAVQISFTDEGPEFDPLACDAPDITLAAEDRELGRLGIHLICTYADDVAYARLSGQNNLRLTFTRKE